MAIPQNSLNGNDVLPVVASPRPQSSGIARHSSRACFAPLLRPRRRLSMLVQRPTAHMSGFCDRQCGNSSTVRG